MQDVSMDFIGKALLEIEWHGLHELAESLNALAVFKVNVFLDLRQQLR